MKNNYEVWIIITIIIIIIILKKRKLRAAVSNFGMHQNHLEN